MDDDPDDRWVNPSALLPLLERIEELPPDAAGAYVLEGRQGALGWVLVQGGRVCWAVSSRMRGRLTDLLVEQSGGQVVAQQFERCYQTCRELGTPLGETLVRHGLVEPEGLHAALFRHGCEALLACARSRSRRWSWRTLQSASYDPRFTFTPAELYIGLSASQHPELARSSAGVLWRTVPDGAAGLAYCREHAMHPIACTGTTAGVQGLRELGNWLAGVTDVAQALTASAELTLRDEAYRALFAWRAQQLVYLVACDDPSDLTYVLARRARPSP